MSIFCGIKDAKASGASAYLEPGVYLLEVLALKTGKARDGRNFFVAEFKTLESSNDGRPAGSVQAWMVMLDARYMETSLGNIKSFLATLMSIPASEVDEAGVEMAVSADNPCAGMQVRCSAVNIKTKNQKDFTKATWLPA